jgi:hypothetical protein
MAEEQGEKQGREISRNPGIEFIHHDKKELIRGRDSPGRDPGNIPG